MSFYCNKKICIRAIVIVLVAFVGLTVGIPNAFASENAFNTNKINIQGNHIVKNKEDLKSGVFTFVLTAENKDNPMPEGSVNGVKEVSISPGETFDFGEIKFQRQGKYKYTVSRKILKSKDLKQDDSVYNAEVTVFSDGTAVLVFREVGKEGKPNKILYEDTYIKKTPTGGTIGHQGQTAKTGDEFDFAKYIALFIASMIVAFIVIARGRKNVK